MQGIVIGWLGILFGGVLGVITAINIPKWVPIIEQFFGFQIMPGDVFYVTAIPSLLIFSDIVIVTLVALALIAVATLLALQSLSEILKSYLTIKSNG